jgi:hypothetical protein
VNAGPDQAAVGVDVDLGHAQLRGAQELVVIHALGALQAAAGGVDALTSSCGTELEPCITSGKPGSCAWISASTSKRRAWLPENLKAPWLVPMATASESQPERSTNSRACFGVGQLGIGFVNLARALRRRPACPTRLRPRSHGWAASTTRRVISIFLSKSSWLASIITEL